MPESEEVSSYGAHVRGADPELSAVLDYRHKKSVTGEASDGDQRSPSVRTGRKARSLTMQSMSSIDSRPGDVAVTEEGLKLWRYQLMAALYGGGDRPDDIPTTRNASSVDETGPDVDDGYTAEDESDGSSSSGSHDSTDRIRKSLHDKDYEGDYEDNESDNAGDDIDGSSSEGFPMNSRSSLASVADALSHMTSYLSSWSWSESKPEVKPLAEWDAAAWGVISARPASADADTEFDVDAIREALGLALACALSPPEGEGIAVAIEFFKEPRKKSQRCRDKALPTEALQEDESDGFLVEYAFEVLVEDPNDSELFRAALEFEAACGGARRLLPLLAERLIDAGKAVPRCLRIAMDSERPCDPAVPLSRKSRSRLHEEWLANRNNAGAMDKSSVVVPSNCSTVRIDAGTKHGRQAISSVFAGPASNTTSDSKQGVQSDASNGTEDRTLDVETRSKVKSSNGVDHNKYETTDSVSASTEAPPSGHEAMSSMRIARVHNDGFSEDEEHSA